MKIRIHAHHLTVSDALDQYVHKRFASLEKHGHEITNVEFTLKIENKKSIAEAKINLPGTDIFASADDEDMYAAIDKLVPKIDRQLKKHKEKASNK